MRTLRGALRDLPVVDALAHRAGPSVWRVPRSLRRRSLPEVRIPKLAGARSFPFAPGDALMPALPETLGRVSTLSPLALRAKRFPPAEVTELPSVMLVGRHATPFSADGRMLLSPFRNELGFLGAEPQLDLNAWISEPDRRQTIALPSGTICSLVSRFDVNYFHWLTEQCAAIEGVEAYAAATGQSPRLLVRTGLPRFALELLTLLGVHSGDIVEWPEPWSAAPWRGSSAPLSARVDRFVLSSARGHRHGVAPASMRWLRGRLLAAIGFYPGDPSASSDRLDGSRLYVQRDASAWRSVINESELAAWATENGFSVIRPELMSVREQLAHFASARVIIALHGAGLTNVVAAPNAAVVELAGSYGGPEYFGLCRALGNRYLRVQCAPHGENVEVDLRQVAQAVFLAESETPRYALEPKG